MNSKVLVLGGFGFLGKVVANRAKEAGFDVICGSRRNGWNTFDAQDFARKLSSLRPAVIINCAAHVGSVHYAMQFSADMLHDNMMIIGNVYDAVRRVSAETLIVNPISNCSYPGDANVHYEPDWLAGPVHSSVMAYGNPRRMIYFYSDCFYRQYGVRSANWLVANSYGPGDYSDPQKVHALNGIIIRLLRAQKAGEKTFEIWGTGTPLREWIYVDDAARALVMSCQGKEQIYPINIAQHVGYSILQIAEFAAERMGYNTTFTFNTNYADGAPIKILDNREFKREWPDFMFTPIEKGVENTIDYYRSALFE